MNPNKLTEAEAQQLRQRYNPEGSLLRSDQMELLAMLNVIADICRQHDIPWWLSSGTLLGAARHEGFIPWDDDVDIVLLRRDYKRLKRILLSLESEEFVFHTMDSDVEYVNTFGKFRKRKGEVMIAGGRYKYLRYKGQFIDIFCIEKTSYLAARAARVLYMNLQHLTLGITTKWLRHVAIRLIEMLCLGIINPVLRLVGKINPKGEYHYALGTGWAKHTFFMEDTFPLSTITFEGHAFPAPKDVDSYLGNVYGNWRELPSEECIRRSIHSREYVEEIYGKDR